MSGIITGIYQGNSRVELSLDNSIDLINTATPQDSNKDVSAFSPTDLLAAGVGSCMLTIIGIVAERNQINIKGAKVEVEKSMEENPPRRISQLIINIYLPSAITEDHRKKLEKSAMKCPAHHSLHPDIKSIISFKYEL